MALTRWRIALVAAAGAVVGFVAGGIFDRFLFSMVLPPVVVGAVAQLTVCRPRWLWRGSLLVSTLGAVVLSVLLVDGSLGDATTGLWSGPRRLVTTEWPSPVDPWVVGTIAVLVGVATTIAISLAARPRWHLLPLLPLTVAFVVVVALGAPLPPAWWSIAALGALAGLFALARHTDDDRPLRRPASRDRTVIASVLTVAVASLLASSALAWSDRADPRRTEDATSSAALLDPIEATVALRQADPPLELFEVVDRSTLIAASLPARWRTAALDTYDGQRWVPRLTLRPIGGRLGMTSSSLDLPPPIRYDLTLLTDDLDLLPFPGRPLAVDVPVETDLDRVAVRLRERPVPGMVVEAESEVAPRAESLVTGSVSTRQVDEIAGTFTSQARNIAGSGTVIEQIRSIEDDMRTEWRLDSGAPGGGQQLALVERFVTETQRGTREQFVTAFVLLVRSLGFDARVAVGFLVEPDRLDSPLTIDSTQAAVWPEVRLDDVGWLAFDPVPPVEATDDDEPPPPPDAQSPAAAQPPIAPPAEESDDVDETVTDVDQDDSRWSNLRTFVLRSVAVAGLTLLPVVIVVALILITKWRRRRRRLAVEHPWLRVRGAWANTTDSLVDAGLRIEPAWTDERIADSGVPLAPGRPHEMRRLAAMATAMTFGPTDGAARLVDDAVLTSKSVDDAIRADRTRWQRIVWRLSLRSLRRSTRSPVDV